MKRLLLLCSLLVLAGCSSTQTAQNTDRRADDQARAAIEKRAAELSAQGFSYRDALARAESEYTGSLAPLRRAESGRRVLAGTPVN
jgi:uncharacterized lipoprotein YajG